MMKAYVHLSVSVDDNGIVFKDATLASQPAGSMAMTGVDKGMYVNMLEVTCGSYQDGCKQLMNILFRMGEFNPVCRIVYDILKEKNKDMIASLKLSGFDTSNIELD